MEGKVKIPKSYITESNLNCPAAIIILPTAKWPGRWGHRPLQCRGGWPHTPAWKSPDFRTTAPKNRRAIHKNTKIPPSSWASAASRRIFAPISIGAKIPRLRFVCGSTPLGMTGFFEIWYNFLQVRELRKLWLILFFHKTMPFYEKTVLGLGGMSTKGQFLWHNESASLL